MWPCVCMWTVPMAGQILHLYLCLSDKYLNLSKVTCTSVLDGIPEQIFFILTKVGCDRAHACERYQRRGKYQIYICDCQMHLEDETTNHFRTGLAQKLYSKMHLQNFLKTDSNLNPVNFLYNHLSKGCLYLAYRLRCGGLRKPFFNPWALYILSFEGCRILWKTKDKQNLMLWSISKSTGIIHERAFSYRLKVFVSITR